MRLLKSKSGKNKYTVEIISSLSVCLIYIFYNSIDIYYAPSFFNIIKKVVIFQKVLYLVTMLRQESFSFPRRYIYYRKFMTFLRTGRILHFFFLTSLILFIISFKQVKFSDYEYISVYGMLSLFFFSLCVTTELDAYSRYQNYKMIKDILHKYRFRELIIKPFSKSSCQRDAALEAARQLDMHVEADKYYARLGYKWYHIIPSMLIDNPLLFFTKMYWSSTFFVPRYQSKYFCW